MQRYFVKGHLGIGQELTLEPEDSHHLIRVMRASQGTQVIIVDEDAKAFVASLQSQIDGKALLRIEMSCNQQVELPVDVTIACGLSKNDKVEWIVQKATECGMHRFIPLSLTRDVVKWDHKKQGQRQERLTKIAKEAAEQSHRVKVPTVESLMNMTAFIEATKHCQHRLIAYEETAKVGEHQRLVQVLQQCQVGDEIAVVFGSEGGLTEKEVAILESVGFERCSLGPRILRAETAPVYFLSAVSYALELR